jgi:hypothetical protein
MSSGYSGAGDPGQSKAGSVYGRRWVERYSGGGGGMGKECMQWELQRGRQMGGLKRWMGWEMVRGVTGGTEWRSRGREQGRVVGKKERESEVVETADTSGFWFASLWITAVDPRRANGGVSVWEQRGGQRRVLREPGRDDNRGGGCVVHAKKAGVDGAPATKKYTKPFIMPPGATADNPCLYITVYRGGEMQLNVFPDRRPASGMRQASRRHPCAARYRAFRRVRRCNTAAQAKPENPSRVRN